jgi:phosphatidylserine decarboxylase
VTTLLERIAAGAQALLPQHAIARVVYALARARVRWLKDALIGAFVRAYGVDMREADPPDARAYPTFNAFFTRPLAAGARTWTPAPDAIASPVDGAVSMAGVVDGERLLQAKGHAYTLTALLAGDAALAERFRDGAFATIYLAPRDYHRIHMPVDGALVEMLHVPGRLYSVNAATERAVPGLFARNERAICVFDTGIGPLALVLVGALIVGCVETVWHGEVRSAHGRVERWRYPERPRFARGAEVGRFNVGSTVIVLCGRGAVEWDPALVPGAPLRLGQAIGRTRAA